MCVCECVCVGRCACVPVLNQEVGPPGYAQVGVVNESH